MAVVLIDATPRPVVRSVHRFWGLGGPQSGPRGHV